MRSVNITLHMLVELLAKQKQEGLSDSAFAAKLKCSREWWNQVKNRRQPLTKNLAINAMKAFPSLTLDVMKYLQGGDHDKG